MCVCVYFTLLNLKPIEQSSHVQFERYDVVRITVLIVPTENI